MPHATFFSLHRPHVRNSTSARLRVMFSGWTVRARAQLRIWRERSFNREYLRTASDIELRDMGMSRFEAQREAAKGFWQP